MTIKIEVKESDDYTPKQLEVLKKVAEGHADKEIARLLGISLRTVEYHLDNLYQKNNLKWQSVNRRMKLVTKAIADGVIKITSISVFLAVFSAQVSHEKTVNNTQVEME